MWAVGACHRILKRGIEKKLIVTWFGGEPLLATDVIESLSARLIATAEERGCADESLIFTNGYLITQEVVDMLSRFLNTCTTDLGDKCHECVWLPLCGGGCPQLRLFGKHECPPYRYDPEAFVLAMHARMHR